jgi:hypothetical protein
MDVIPIVFREACRLGCEGTVLDQGQEPECASGDARGGGGLGALIKRLTKSTLLPPIGSGCGRPQLINRRRACAPLIVSVHSPSPDDAPL